MRPWPNERIDHMFVFCSEKEYTILSVGCRLACIFFGTSCFFSPLEIKIILGMGRGVTGVIRCPSRVLCGGWSMARLAPFPPAFVAMCQYAREVWCGVV